MSRAIDRHRMRVADQRGDADDVAIYGDAQTTALATSAVAEALKMAGGLGAAHQQKQEDKAKADKEKADKERATAAAGDARTAATAAKNKAQLAAMQAQAEQNQSGPLHQAALRAAQEAASLDETARRLEAAAGIYVPPLSMVQPGSSSPWYTKVPSWVWWTGGAGAGVGAIVLMVRALRPRRDYSRYAGAHR